MAYVKVPFIEKPVRESTLHYSLGTLGIALITLLSYEAAQGLDAQYEFLRHGGDVHELGQYPYLSPVLSDEKIVKWTIDLPLVISVFSVFSFPLVVLPTALKLAGEKRMGERLEANAPNF